MHDPDEDKDENKRSREGVLEEFRARLKEAGGARVATLREFKKAERFYDGHHWTDEQIAELEARERAPIVINKVKRIVDVVCGLEALNRSEPVFIARTIEPEAGAGGDDTQEADLATQALKYFRQACLASAAERELFRHSLFAFGCTNTRIDLEAEPKPAVVIENIDPVRVLFDPHADQTNASNGRYIMVWDTMSRAELERQWPGKWDEILGHFGELGAIADDEEEAARSGKPSSDYDEGGTERDWWRRARAKVYEYQYRVSECYYEWEDPASDAHWAALTQAALAAGREPPLREADELSEEDYAAAAAAAKKALKEVEKRLGELRKDPPDGEVLGPAVVMEQERRVQLALEEQALLTDRAERLGDAVKRTRRICMQCFVAAEGSVLLSEPRRLPTRAFTYQLVLGHWDRKLRCYYGLVRAMFDPQVWYNKTVSGLIDILQSSPKGGILAEKSAVEDLTQIEESYARHDAVTIVGDGAISGVKITEKKPAQIPPIMQALLQLAGSSIELVSGVNPELMGTGRGANTPVGTAGMRNRQGYTLLAFYFDQFSFYKRAQARVALDLMRVLPDQQIRRITAAAQGGEVWRTFSADKLAPYYDVVVDEGAESPNRQEEVIQVLQGIVIPQLKAAGVPVSEFIPFIDWLPALPATLKEKIKAMLMKSATPGAPMGAGGPMPGSPPGGGPAAAGGPLGPVGEELAGPDAGPGPGQL